MHDNALSHLALATQKKPAYLGFQKTIERSHFSSDAEVIAAAETWLDGQSSEFFEWLAKVTATG